jgi:hypothetical protein
MKKLYQFYVDCGKEGEREGVFLAEEEDILGAYGKVATFCGALGEDSDVSVVLSADSIYQLVEDKSFLETFQKHLPDFCSGINPLDYLEEER